jgi:hypothetical protein
MILLILSLLRRDGWYVVRIRRPTGFFLPVSEAIIRVLITHALSLY